VELAGGLPVLLVLGCICASIARITGVFAGDTVPAPVLVLGVLLVLGVKVLTHHLGFYLPSRGVRIQRIDVLLGLRAGEPGLVAARGGDLEFVTWSRKKVLAAIQQARAAQGIPLLMQ